MNEDTIKQDQIIMDVLKREINSLGLLRPGDLVRGVVLEKGVRIMTIDLGPHGVGAVYRGEMQNAREIVKSLKSGDEINAKVISVDNEDGYTELSMSQADKQKAWETVEELKEQEEILTVKLISFNKGGLVTDVRGLQAFLPISQLVSGFEGKAVIENKEEINKILEDLVGKEVKVRIIDVNPRTNKLIVSEKAAVEVSAKELTQNYSVGQIIDGVVSGVADFGVFVRFTDNPAVEGLIHVSELGYKIIENPKDVVKVDNAVNVKIIEIKDGKISLSLKALKPNPWIHAAEMYSAGQEITGVIHGFHPFGAIVDLKGEIQGQIHVASFGSVDEMKKQITIGENYEFEIESFNPEERKLLLKLKR